MYPYFRISINGVVLKKSCNTCQNANSIAHGGSLYCNRASTYTVCLTTSIIQDQDACKGGVYEFWEPSEKFIQQRGPIVRLYQMIFGKPPVGTVIDGEHVKD